jgi:hypothetical protein
VESADTPPLTYAVVIKESELAKWINGPNDGRRSRIHLPEHELPARVAEWCQQNPKGRVMRDAFVASFQKETNCDRDTAGKCQASCRSGFVTTVVYPTPPV